MLVNSHLLDNGKLDKEYDLNNKIQLNEYSCMDIPNAVYNKLGELEDVLEEFELTSAEDLRHYLNFQDNMAIWEGKLELKNKIADLEQELAELKEKLAQYENIEKEIGCDIEVFWKVYRRLSGHGKSDIHLYSIFNNEIVEIMPTEIISGTYSNYPQDCSFKYLVWDKICESYQETYSYFHFHDYNNEWFLSKEEAEQKLAEIKGEKDE